jgi:hypothetical protein
MHRTSARIERFGEGSKSSLGADVIADHAVSLREFGNCIECPVNGMNRQESRKNNFCGHRRRTQFPGQGVKGGMINPIPLRDTRPEVDVERLRAGANLGSCSCQGHCKE